MKIWVDDSGILGCGAAFLGYIIPLLWKTQSPHT